MGLCRWEISRVMPSVDSPFSVLLENWYSPVNFTMPIKPSKLFKSRCSKHRLLSLKTPYKVTTNFYITVVPLSHIFAFVDKTLTFEAVANPFRIEDGLIQWNKV